MHGDGNGDGDRAKSDGDGNGDGEAATAGHGSVHGTVHGDGERPRRTATATIRVMSGGHFDEHGHDSVEQGLSSATGGLVDELQYDQGIEDGTALVG